MDTRNPELDIQTRMFQLPLLRRHFLFCTSDKQIFIRDHDIHEPCCIDTYEIHPYWRKLPPLHGLVMRPPARTRLPSRTTMVASTGMVYVWSDDVSADGEGPNFVLKLDIGRADWTWSVIPVPYAFNFNAISFNSKIYVPGIFARGSKGLPSRKKVVLVHDMMTDTCKQMETWTQENLRVLPKCAHSNLDGEDMYSFVEEDFDTKLHVLMYDVESELWRTREEVPIPECRWSHLPDVELLTGDCFELLNGDCFEPAPETGINVIWIDREGEVISWFNSSVGSMWVEFYYNPCWGAKYLEYMELIGGLMYGIFCDEQEEEEDADKEDDKGFLLEVPRRSIMKGKLIVADNIVAWEEVHEIGFFKESFHINSLVQPIDCYTLMA